MAENGFIVTIQNNSNRHYRESRIYGTYSTAKAYLRDQATIYDVPWNNQDTLVAGGHTITILPKGLAPLRKQKHDREPCSCVLL